MTNQMYVYGDSLLKATVPDERFRYHFHIAEMMKDYVDQGLDIVNRAKMGATIRKGKALVEHDLDRGMEARCALVAYGGNDCDYKWAEVAADPDGEHHCNTELPEFVDTLRQTTQELQAKGIQPILMTLPPIDAEKYFDFLSRDLDKDRILSWLGDKQMIYRYQELNSDTVADFARESGLPLIPDRRGLLMDRGYRDLISADGIHMTLAGYHKLYDTVAGWLKKNL